MQSATRILCRVLVLTMALLPMQAARAEMISVDQAMASRMVASQSAAKQDLSRELQALGVPQDAALERVAALTDEEAAAVAGELRSAPAGGNGAWIFLGVLLFVAWVVYYQLHRK
jgi:hypothetical protein